eukprot:TRINITY_DN14062_c0_g1_i1.p1 TRINITY_DN14062_c0_g1~~TRINITY_DN14062_c0_g1_i1.p1  ORF type:complete len:540 (+),score=174.19 TRINITY_DN14062_c0_g1_i1:581-2200(+)
MMMTMALSCSNFLDRGMSLPPCPCAGSAGWRNYASPKSGLVSFSLAGCREVNARMFRPPQVTSIQMVDSALPRCPGKSRKNRCLSMGKGVGRLGGLVLMLARQAGLEPATFGLEGRCSIHLSYWRAAAAILTRGSAVQSPELATRARQWEYRPRGKGGCMTRVAPNPDNLVTVDLDAVASNLAALRALLPAGLGVAGVVKADAYGHGLVPVARRLKAEGAEALAVAVPWEGVLLRRAGIQGPILVMMGLGADGASVVAAHGLTPFLATGEDFAALSQAAQGLGLEAEAHLKVDTGMSRLGVHAHEALELLARAAALPGIRVSGLASHLATAGEPGDSHALRQAQTFTDLLGEARHQGFDLPQSSLAGSGGVLAPPESTPAGLGLVRLGISLYGGLPAPGSQGQAPLTGAMRFTSRLAAVKRVPAGACVSYGCTWTAPYDTWLGVVAAGYSDGYPRSASNQASVLINGQLAPMRGRVCMNAFMVELTGLDPLPSPGDEVVLLGRSGGAEITADQLGDWAGTISYEITCSLGAANLRRHQP